MRRAALAVAFVFAGSCFLEWPPRTSGDAGSDAPHSDTDHEADSPTDQDCAPLSCDNGLFCDGVERCTSTGCVEGTPPPLEDGVDCTLESCDEEADRVVSIPLDDRCDDSDPCTTDRCDSTDGCLRTTRDRDGDGHGDGECGGADCHDGAETIHPGAPELCNARDDDCDGEIDEEVCMDCDRGVWQSSVYLFCSTPRAWHAARDSCFERGYHLVIIDSSEENDWLWSQARAVAEVHWYIGLTDEANEGDYVWVDGRTAWEGGADGAPLTFTQFAGGTPGENLYEDCLILAEDRSGEWVEIGCSRPMAFICEHTFL